MIDSVNFNYDLDPAGKRPSRGIWWAPTLSSQAMNIDTDLLKSIEVIDSGVSAKYGGFQGGVVNAKTRDPQKGFHGILSTSHTSKNWSKIFIDPVVEKNYTENPMMLWLNKSDFSKWRYRAGMEGYVSENFGLLFDYTRTSSTIKNITKPGVMDSSIATQPDDKRRAENYFIKGVVNVGDNVILRPSFLYALHKDRTSIEYNLGSDMSLHLGGYAAAIEADIDLDAVFLEQSLSYSRYTTSRYFDDKGGLYEYRKSNIKNWGNYNSRGTTYSYQGGLNDIKENQKNLSYKLDASLKEFEAIGALHDVKGGLELTSQRGSYEVLTPYNSYGSPSALPTGYVCASGDKTCINDDSFGGRGQFLTTRKYYGNVKNTLNLNKISFYIEDEMKFGKFKIRPGVRVERDSFNNDINVAPRLVSEYEFLDKNFLGFGLNRYYGRNFFAYKIFNDMQAHYKTYKRTAPNQDFTLDETDKTIGLAPI